MRFLALLPLVLLLACPDPRGDDDADDDDSAVDDDDSAADDDDAGDDDGVDDDDTSDPDADLDGDGIPNGEELIYGEDCAISDPTLADTDEDGVGDNEDPYPRDPHPEYVLHRNDLGTIHLTLSNRDGTFVETVSTGDPFGGTTNDAYRYTGFVVADFDNTGTTDFLAVGDPDPAGEGPLDLWWFGRQADPYTFSQRLITSELEGKMWGGASDLDGDQDMDLFMLETNGGFIDQAVFYSFLNTGLVQTADCAWTDDVANPDGCAFVRVLAADITTWASGQWVVRHSREAVDVTGDGFLDLALIKQASGGNVEQPLALMEGLGDGTFAQPGVTLLTHNQPGSGQSPIQSIVFADFDGDDLGDVIVGLDDDGDAGAAWFYPGTTAGGSFGFDVTGAFEAFDLNPIFESGSDNWGVTTSARAFDLDFDGVQDILVGYNWQGMGIPPTRTVFLRGNGDGSFQPEVVFYDVDTLFGDQFALPQALCRRYPIAR